ncbi:MAG: nitroreductase [Bergeyella sp.]|nr:nitroreductase [Bergeyella sp.]
MSENKKMSRSSFLGVLGVLGTVPLLTAGCKEKKIERVVYKGGNKEAILNNILTRRAIRKYTDQEVAQEMLDTVMRCAIFAPSATNAQPWEVRVIRNQDILTEINERWRKTAAKKDTALARDLEFSVFHHAPVLIVIAGDSKNPKARVDVGIMLQTILLSAHGLGLGTCPIGMLIPPLTLPENRDIIKLLNIPEGYEVMGNVALGYPDESPEAPVRFSDKVKYIV